MKTTLDINDALLANAKAMAARHRTSLTRLIEEGLQLRLAAAVVQLGEHLVTFDTDFKKLLRRSQLTVLPPG